MKNILLLLNNPLSESKLRKKLLQKTRVHSSPSLPISLQSMFFIPQDEGGKRPGKALYAGITIKQLSTSHPSHLFLYVFSKALTENI